MLVVTACSPFNSQEKAAIEWKRGLFQRLQNNLSEPIVGRVQKMPADLLKATQDYDRSIGIEDSNHYVARTPSTEELELINSYYESLPIAYKKAFSEKLLAVYLVDGFAGAGMTDWLVDRDGHTYYYLVLNSSLFNLSLDDWLTYKENSIFDKSAVSPRIRVRTNTNYRAIMYGLLHEGAHIVDYELGIAPYVDPLHRKVSGRTQVTSAFTDGVWLQRSQTVAQYNFMHRAVMNIYGEFAKKDLIPRVELPEMFSQLIQTPFVTFYSGTSWNEDLADYMTYQYIERSLGGTVTVELLHQGKIIEQYAPIKTPQVQQREKSVRVFYD